uniref:Uncharacterized protein n=1 Tax=Timema douglasi TaxID=61478 RepID=A0A7R8VQA6_TIMDO|nr:unnamed protein product [Timema douglasi]
MTIRERHDLFRINAQLSTLPYSWLDHENDGTLVTLQKWKVPSGWRKLRNIVQWTPFFQTYKKQRYPWVQLAGHQGMRDVEHRGNISAFPWRENGIPCKKTYLHHTRPDQDSNSGLPVTEIPDLYSSRFEHMSLDRWTNDRVADKMNSACRTVNRIHAMSAMAVVDHFSLVLVGAREWSSHTTSQRNFKAGPEQGTILKKLCPKEELCFQVLMKDVLRPYVPEYKGHVTCEDGECILYKVPSFPYQKNNNTYHPLKSEYNIHLFLNFIRDLERLFHE